MVWRVYVYDRSSGRSGCLERKGEERGHAEKAERHEIIPRKFLLQKRGREDDEDDDRDNLLNNLKLVSRKVPIAEAIRGHRRAVFEHRNPPRAEERLGYGHFSGYQLKII